MSIPTNAVSIGDTTKKSHYDTLYNNAILCDTGGVAGGAQTVPGKKDFSDGIGVDYLTGLSAGNVIGIHTTDLEAWNSGFDVIEFYCQSFMASNTTPAFNMMSNAYYDGAWKYKSTGEAARWNISSGTGIFYTATSGTINTALTWVGKFKIDNTADKIGIGGYVGVPNRDSYFYFASDAYIFWDESESELIFACGGNIGLISNGTSLYIGGGAGGSNRDAYLYFASDAYLRWLETLGVFQFSHSIFTQSLGTTGGGTYDIGDATNYFGDVNAKDYLDRAALWIENPNKAYDIIKNATNEETTGFCAKVENRGQNRLKYSSFPDYCWDRAEQNFVNDIKFDDEKDAIIDSSFQSQNREVPVYTKGQKIIAAGEKSRLRVKMKKRKNESTGEEEEYKEISIAAEGFSLSAGISILFGAVQKLIEKVEALESKIIYLKGVKR